MSCEHRAIRESRTRAERVFEARLAAQDLDNRPFSPRPERDHAHAVVVRARDDALVVEAHAPHKVLVHRAAEHLGEAAAAAAAVCSGCCS